jgi:YHS domain-containing protein
MKRTSIGLVLMAVIAGGTKSSAKEPPEKKTPREALKAFNNLIGAWRATGTPEGTREDKQRGFWTESMSWEWQFKGRDAWLQFAADRGKHFVSGELHYLPDKNCFELIVRTPTKELLQFTGPFKDSVLTLERVDDKTAETQRLVVSFLHENRFVYRYEVKPKGRTLFARKYQVGATKEGEPFAGPGDSQPECVVSGGKGTIKVMYKSKPYYVCCSGCHSAFKDDPEKYIKEFEEKKAKAR